MTVLIDTSSANVVLALQCSRHEDEENTPPCKKQRVSAAELVMRDLAVASSYATELPATIEHEIEQNLDSSEADVVSAKLLHCMLQAPARACTTCVRPADEDQAYACNATRLAVSTKALGFDSR
jgi:hypothetical protein